MIDVFKRYPAYKYSGAPWLDRVPEHWEVLPGRAVFREIDDRGHPDEQVLSVTITRGVVRQQDLLPSGSKKHFSYKDKSNYKLVQPGDLVYNKMRAWQGAIGVSPYRGIVSPAHIVCRPTNPELLPRYMHFLLRTPLFAAEAKRWSHGITSDRWSLRAEDFKCIYFSLPPLPEQTAIVRFLEYVDRRIRRVTHARQRQIKLLLEYRQALILRAVTGQIDVRTGKPYPAYKDSGAPWLGRVPEHWAVLPPKRALRSEPAGTAAVKNTAQTKPLPGFVPAFGASGQDVWLPKPTHEGSALVLSTVGATCGKTFYAHGKWAVLPNTHVLWPRDGQNRDFWWYVTNIEDWWLREASDEPFVHVRATLDRPWVIPPLAEQTAIVQYLDVHTVFIDAAIAAIRYEIELLREYRERITAHVVIGDVDIREEAAQLPEERQHESEITEIEVPDGNDDEPFASSDVSWEVE
jgi:type I restriction enzyme S subunit